MCTMYIEKNEILITIKLTGELLELGWILLLSNVTAVFRIVSFVCLNLKAIINNYVVVLKKKTILSKD